MTLRVYVLQDRRELEEEVLTEHRYLFTKASQLRTQTDDGFSVWAQLSKQGHEFLVASTYGPHTPSKRAAIQNRLRNSFLQTNILLCGDWNMVDLLEDS